MNWQRLYVGKVRQLPARRRARGRLGTGEGLAAADRYTYYGAGGFQALAALFLVLSLACGGAGATELPSTCSEALRDATAQTERCLRGLDDLSPAQQEAVAADYLTMGRRYAEPSDLLAAADAGTAAAERRLRAAAFAALATDGTPPDEAALAEALTAAREADDAVALAWLRWAQAEAARLDRDKEAQARALGQAEALARSRRLLGLLPRIESERGDLDARGQAFTAAAARYEDAFEGYVAVGDRYGAGRACFKFGYAYGWSEDVTDGAMAARIAAAEREEAPLLPCLLSSATERAHQRTEDHASVSAYGGRALAEAEARGLDPMRGYLLNLLAISAKRDGLYAEAVDLYERASVAYEETGPAFMVGAVTGNLGQLLLDIGDPERATEMFRRSLEATLATAPDRLDHVATGHFRIANARAAAGRHEAAAASYERASEASAAQEVRYLDGMIGARHAQTLYALGQEDRALSMAERAVDIILSEGDAPEAMRAAQTLTWLANMRLERGEPRAAEAALIRAERITDPDGKGASGLMGGTGDAMIRLAFARGMADTLTASGRPAEAAPYARAALTLSETRFETEKMRALANAELRYRMRDQERALALAEQEAALTRLELRTTRLGQAVGVGGAGAAALVAFALWRAYETERRATRSKDVLLAEVHHRTGNNMQLISSLLAMDARRGPVDAKRVAGRARTMAMLHDHIHHHGEGGSVEAPAFFEELAHLLEEALGREEIEIEARADPVALDVAQVTPCGLIVCEAVTNALKHAFVEREHGTVEITLSSAPDGMTLTIRDDGVGLGGARREGSQGLELMEELAAQMGGRMAVHSDERGTSVAVRGIPEARRPRAA